MLDVAVECDVSKRGLALLGGDPSRVEYSFFPFMTEYEFSALVGRRMDDNERTEHVGAAGGILMRFEEGAWS